MGVDGAPSDLEIDGHVGRDRRRRAEGVDKAGVGVHGGHVIAYGGVITQALDAAAGGAGPDRHQEARRRPHHLGPLGVLARGHRAFDQRNVVGPCHHGTRDLEEIGNLHRFRPTPAIPPRGRAGSAGSRRRRRTSKPPGWGVASPGSQLGLGQEPAGGRVSDDGPAAAQDVRPELAVTANTAAALHIAFERYAQAYRGRQHATLYERLDGEAHHDLGPHTRAMVRAASNPAPFTSWVTTPTLPFQPSVPMSTVMATSAPR